MNIKTQCHFPHPHFNFHLYKKGPHAKTKLATS